jgi:hypothetical protein
LVGIEETLPLLLLALPFPSLLVRKASPLSGALFFESALFLCPLFLEAAEFSLSAVLL